MLIPGQPVPTLNVPTIAGENFDISTSKPEHFTMVVFYRGLHCPVCQKYLGELAQLQTGYEKNGVSVVVISGDDKARSEEMMKKTKGDNLSWGYDLPLTTARDWGLYISSSRGKTSSGIEEPPLFSEPGVFLVRPDQSLFYSAVQTMPFARPVFKELLGGIEFVIANDYPARGDYTGSL